MYTFHKYSKTTIEEVMSSKRGFLRGPMGKVKGCGVERMQIQCARV